MALMRSLSQYYKPRCPYTRADFHNILFQVTQTAEQTKPPSAVSRRIYVVRYSVSLMNNLLFNRTADIKE